MGRMVYFNGRCVPARDADIGIDNGGWLHGAGLFETMRACNGQVFKLEQHLDRLCGSARRLLKPLERSVLPDQNLFQELLRQNELRDARVRLTVTAGSVLPQEGEEPESLTICATAAELTPYRRALYDKGIMVLISKYRQSPDDPLAGHKTTNFLARLIALNEAHQAGCDEALWFSTKSLLAEGCISNVFVVKSGVVVTPPPDTPVLPGIARATVLEICRQQGIKAEQRAVTINDLLDADEVFLTNVIMQVMPVRQIEKRPIGDGRPGPITRGLLEQFQKCVEDECQDHGNN